MEQLIVYKASDGRRFDSEEQCREHEELLGKVNVIISSLCPVPDTCEFANGKGYVQQERDVVIMAKDELLSLGRQIYNKPDLSFGWMGRYCDDSGNRTLYNAWGRLSNIDIYFREWGQGYYALNPNEGKQIKLN